MPAVFRPSRLLAALATVALAASFLVVGGSSVSAVVTHPPLTVSKTTAHSGLDHGDQIDESGDGCTDEAATSVIMYLATGVVADDQPIDTDLTAFGFSAAPDDSGHWSGVFTVTGGSPESVLPAGQYTLRTECEAGISQLFIYAGVVITINGDEVTTTTAPTTTADPGTTSTTAAAGATSTTAAAGATSTTAAPAAAVAAKATFTG